MPIEVPQLVTYTLTNDDHIESIGGEWLPFAQANGAPELTDEAVVGRSLWDFVSGDGTRQLYESIFQRVRRDDVVCVLPFRCDSPTVSRHMIMRIGKNTEKLIALQCDLIESRTRQILRLLDFRAEKNQDHLTDCSICLKALVEPVGWIEIEDAALCLHLLEKETVPQLVYMVCPSCEEMETLPPDLWVHRQCSADQSLAIDGPESAPEG